MKVLPSIYRLFVERYKTSKHEIKEKASTFVKPFVKNSNFVLSSAVGGISDDTHTCNGVKRMGYDPYFLIHIYTYMAFHNFYISFAVLLCSVICVHYWED